MPESETAPGKNAAKFAVGCSPVCDVVRKPKRKKRKSRPWHRVLGMFSALPLVWVLLTGVILNHSEDFKLDAVELRAPFILSAYGMTPKGEPSSVVVHGHSITAWDGLVFFDQDLVSIDGDFLTAFPLADSVVVVSDQAVLRLDLNGEVIEKLDELSLPELPLVEAGVLRGNMVLRGAGSWYLADSDWLEFSEVTEEVSPITMKPLEDGDLKDAIQVRWAGGGISLYRLVLDLHAGNFLGKFAVYFYDFVVLCTLWLIGTGLVLQYRVGRRSRVTR